MAETACVKDVQRRVNEKEEGRQQIGPTGRMVLFWFFEAGASEERKGQVRRADLPLTRVLQ